MKRYVLIAGETSGDQYGSQLMEALKEIDSESEFWGIGGEDMIGSGLNQLENIHNMSVVGFSEALKKVPTMLNLANRLSQFISDVKPDRVILIDFPGFNLSLAKKIKQSLILVVITAVILIKFRKNCKTSLKQDKTCKMA